MKRLLLSLFLMVFASVSWSQALPTSTPFSVSSVGSVSTFGGTTASAANAASFTFGNAANGPLYATANARIQLPENRTASVVVKSLPAGAAVGTALLNFARKTVVPLQVGMAVYDLAKELGFLLSKDTSGNLVVQKPDPNACTVAPCYQYTYDYSTGWFPSVDAAASAYAASTKANTGSYGYQYVGYPGGAWNGPTQFNWVRRSDGAILGSFWQSPATQQVTPASSAPLVASSGQEFADAVAAKSSWPAGSNIAPAVQQAIQTEPLALPQPQSVTGPASVVGPVTSSSEVMRDAAGNPAGTRTTTVSNTYNLNYGPNTVTTTTTSTTTVTNPDGTSSTKTESKEDAPSSQASDTPLPDQPKLYTRKYSDGLEGVWRDHRDQLKSSPLLSLVSGLMPSVGSSGTCPTMMLPLDVGIANFGTYNVAPPCWLWDFGRVVIIVSALLLARRLIFGG